MEWISTEIERPPASIPLLVCKYYLDCEFDMEYGGYDESKSFSTAPVLTIDSCYYSSPNDPLCWRGAGIVTMWQHLPQLPETLNGMD